MIRLISFLLLATLLTLPLAGCYPQQQLSQEQLTEAYNQGYEYGYEYGYDVGYTDGWNAALQKGSS